MSSFRVKLYQAVTKAEEVQILGERATILYYKYIAYPDSTSK